MRDMRYPAERLALPAGVRSYTFTPIGLPPTRAGQGWWKSEAARFVVGLTGQALSCKPHSRTSGRAARRLPRCTRCWRWASASGVTPSVSRWTSRLGRRARHSAACRLLRRV